MGIRLSKMFQRNPSPTHDDVATFPASFLPPAPRPRDVEYHYHVPPQYMRPKPPPSPNPITAAFLSRTDSASIPSPATATYLDESHEVKQEQRKNTTPVSHITFSITPTPGVYTSLSTSQSLFARSAAPVAFIHRPWSLERWKIPRGTTVLSSHTGFDEKLTVGWNVRLAERLGVDVGEGREGAEHAQGEASGCICLKGYKGDEERRIGLVGGFGFGKGESRKMAGVQAGESREERGDEDVDGGVRLHAPDDLGEAKVTREQAVSVPLKEMLARIDKEFAGIGEVFEFSPSTKPESLVNARDSSQADNHTPATTVLNTLTLPTSTVTTNPPIQPEISRKPPKRQKKTPLPPPPPLPPSLPLAHADASTLIPDQPVTAIAIMNAFHPEEVERAVSAAYAGGWIKWQPVGLPVKPTDAERMSLSAAQEEASNIQTIVEETIDNTRTIPPVLGSPYGSSTINPKGSILMLTGASRAPGIAHVETHYSNRVVVVCVGHAACEEWGIKFLAEQCRQKWLGVDVREVYEEEVVVPKPQKKKEEDVRRVT